MDVTLESALEWDAEGENRYRSISANLSGKRTETGYDKSAIDDVIVLPSICLRFLESNQYGLALFLFFVDNTLLFVQCKWSF